MSETESEQGEAEVERGKQCEMPECDSHEDVKAVRDPAGNLLDMCADCQSDWPVEVVGDAVATDGGEVDGDTQRCLRCEEEREETTTLYRDGRRWATLCVDCHDAVSMEVADPKRPVTDGGQRDGKIERENCAIGGCFDTPRVRLRLRGSIEDDYCPKHAELQLEYETDAEEVGRAD